MSEPQRRGGPADDRPPLRSPGTPIEPPALETVLPWRSWDEGRAEAQRASRPLLVLAEPAWTTSAQRFAWFVNETAELRACCQEAWVCVHVDPWQRPDVSTRLRFEALRLTGDTGPPLLILLDDRAQPFLAYGTIAYEGSADHPSLASLLHTAAELHQRERERLRREAHARATPSRDGSPVSAAPNDLSDLAGALVDRADTQSGGFLANPKRPMPHALLALLDALEQSPTQPVREFLATTLDGLERGGIRDQIWRGFHRASRDERWVVPHFEKTVPASAALAVVFARAGRLLGVEPWLTLASETLDWVNMALDSCTDAVAAHTAYYTWTPQELRQAVTPEVLQVLGLHYHVTPYPGRQVLHQAIPADRLDQHAHESRDVLLSRLATGRDQLRMARQQRIGPALLAAPRPSWRADALVMAYDCVDALGRAPSSLHDTTEQLAHLAAARGDEEGTGSGPLPWFEDRTTVAHALLRAAATEGAGSAGWRRLGNDLVDELLAPPGDSAGGLGLRTSGPLDAGTSERGPSLGDVLDHDIASAVAHLLAAQRLAPDASAGARDSIRRAFAGAASIDPVHAAGFWCEVLREA